MTTIQPFPSIEKALKQVIEEKYPEANGNVGGDLQGVPADGSIYVWLGLVPGGGISDKTTGQWTIDVDVFARDYSSAMMHANNIEAMLLDAPHRSDQVQIDSVFCNANSAVKPWDDDTAYRIGATYVLTARRKDIV